MGLARAGVDTVILEKHKDFLRDFLGDTIHPSTLEAMHELGLLEDFLKLPHRDPNKRQCGVLSRRLASPL
jgi:2-polyprenyl-6-methoxyphenol hydroxylase-like FAD-dependent oxidoreductase